ncbi:MAG: hypothetical protein KF878_15780 [Planctomycetes bacterium]|nr:hypothetical protein [Planctomycetota bacterium]
MGWLSRWVRTTFDYNPTFPLSALLLLVGLRLLVSDGTLDAQSLEGTAGGVGVLQAYEVALLALALGVLWPRRIAYETTAVLIVFGVVRHAAPFLVIGHAGEVAGPGPWVLGVGLAGLMLAKTWAIQRAVRLDMRPWERAHDAALYLGACVGLPLLVQGLAEATGATLSHAGARGLQLAVCWGAALALSPLALGLPDLGRPGPLRSRRPAAVWRGLALVGLTALFANALWLGGDAPTLLAVLPLALVAAAVATTIAGAAGVDLRGAAVHLPALAALVVLVAPGEVLQGRMPVLSRPAALVATLLVAAACLALIGRARWREGLPGLGAVAALAPLSAASSLRDAEAYALLALLVACGVGAWRRDDRLLVRAAGAAVVVGLHLAWRPLGGAALTAVPLGAAAGLALLVAWRCPDARAAAGLAAALALVPGLVEVVRGPEAPALLLLVGAGGGLAVLGARAGERPLVHAGLALPVVGLLRRAGDSVDPGVALVLLAFAALPVGTAVALRRERSRRLEATDPFEPLDLGPADPTPADRGPAHELAELGPMDLGPDGPTLADEPLVAAAPATGGEAGRAR